MGRADMVEVFDSSVWQGGTYTGGGGYAGALAKASEGRGFKDPAFDRHLASFRRAGIIPGAYHFGRPDLGNAPEAEADWFLTVVGDPRGLLLALDLEVGSGSLWSWRDRFCDRVEAQVGKPCWWYSYHSFIRTRALNTSSADYPFWLAWPDANGPLPVYNFGPVRMQQYGLATVPGLTGGVDANRFFGDVAQLRALTVGGAPVATIGGFAMGSTMGGFRLGDVDHTFETSPDGDVLWGRTGGGAGGHVHVGFWNMGGSGPGPVVDLAAWASGTDIIIRTKYVDGWVLELVVQADAPDQDSAVVLPWYAPDEAGPFRVPAQGPEGEPGPTGPAGASASEVADEIGQRIVNG